MGGRINKGAKTLRRTLLPAFRSRRRAARPARRRSDDVCSHAWPDQWDSDRSGHRRTPRGWNNCPQSRATNQSGQSRSAKWIRSHTPAPLPVAQATPARHPRSAPEFRPEHLPGNAAAEDEDYREYSPTIRSISRLSGRRVRRVRLPARVGNAPTSADSCDDEMSAVRTKTAPPERSRSSRTRARPWRRCRSETRSPRPRRHLPRDRIVDAGSTLRARHRRGDQ
jgi:hypothetical protein